VPRALLEVTLGGPAFSLGGRLSAAITRLFFLSLHSFFFFFSGREAGASPYSSQGFLLLKMTASSLSAWSVDKSRSLQMVFGLNHPIRCIRISHVVPSWKSGDDLVVGLVGNFGQRLEKW
jgi:hypothetical protein